MTRPDPKGQGAERASHVNPLEAALFGFGYLRRAPVTFALLALVHGVLLHAAVITLGPPLWASIQAQNVADRLDGIGAAMSAGWPVLVALAVLGVFSQAAILRALVRDWPGGWVLGLQLGREEFHQLIVSVLFGVLVTAPLLIAAGVLGVRALFSDGAAGVAGLVSPDALAIVALASVLSAILALAFSPAAAASMGERRLVLWKARQLGGGLDAPRALGYAFLLGLAAIVLGLWAGLVALIASFTAGPGGPAGVAALLVSPHVTGLTAILSVAVFALRAARLGAGALAYRRRGGRAGFAGAHPPEEEGLAGLDAKRAPGQHGRNTRQHAAGHATAGQGKADHDTP